MGILQIPLMTIVLSLVYDNIISRVYLLSAQRSSMDHVMFVKVTTVRTHNTGGAGGRRKIKGSISGRRKCKIENRVGMMHDDGRRRRRTRMFVPSIKSKLGFC